MRVRGKLTSWNEARGFGFITPISGGAETFVHIKAFRNRNRRPAVGQILTYTLSSDRQGRPRAIDATLAGDRPPAAGRWRHRPLPIAVALLFLAAVGAAVIFTALPGQVLLLYLAASLLTFIAYALDKSAAKAGGWRTQESTLHLLALVGGWPGALIAQNRLRHKSSKQSFRGVFWITVLLNCGALAWLFTATGRATLHALIRGVT
ncbi:MAG: cold shock and DUF1294 domain-containing protein [Gammaproteobacteria bacterium]|nr:cold shock and DUF1294 domain-containing protein [Gammaproteobacteria bacterium]